MTIRHCHPGDPTQGEVYEYKAEIKQRAGTSRDKPNRIIRDARINQPDHVVPSLPSRSSSRHVIHRLRKGTELQAEPENLNDFVFINE